MNKASFLDFYKTILQGVSFDRELLVKEYNKALNSLKEAEAHDLDYWLKNTGLARKLDVLPVQEVGKEQGANGVKPVKPQPFSKFKTSESYFPGGAKTVL